MAEGYKNCGSDLTMPTLFLMCGLPGSGKTTLAKRIEQEAPALRLTPDEWIASLHIDPHDEEKRATIEAMQCDLALRTLQLGQNAILDFGFWTKQEREAYRAKAHNIGADSKICFCDVPFDELLERLNTRNASPQHGEFHVTKEELALWQSWFEPPEGEELLS